MTQSLSHSPAHTTPNESNLPSFPDIINSNNLPSQSPEKKTQFYVTNLASTYASRKIAMGKVAMSQVHVEELHKEGPLPPKF